jgi:hypothetical protein
MGGRGANGIKDDSIATVRIKLVYASYLKISICHRQYY